MPFRCPSRPLSVVASALVAVGIALAAAGCGHIAPLGPDPSPVTLPPPGPLGSPIIMQVMRSEPPTATGQCPTGSVDLLGLALVARSASVSAVPVSAAPVGAAPVGATPATPTPATSPGLPAGVACYLPVGTPVTITSAAVSSVATYSLPADAPEGPATYGFEVAFPTAYVAALTALIQQAYDSGDAVGMSVAGKLWQAPQPQREFTLRAEQIVLLSRNQALQLYRLLIPSG